MAVVELLVNGGVAQLAAAISATATQLQVRDADVAQLPPSGRYQYRIAVSDGVNTELMLVTQWPASNLLTVTRAVEPYAGVQQAYVFSASTPANPVYVWPVITAASLVAWLQQRNPFTIVDTTTLAAQAIVDSVGPGGAQPTTRLRGLINALLLEGHSLAQVAANLTFDGLNWNRLDTAQPGAVWNFGVGGNLIRNAVPAGANPASLVASNVWPMDTYSIVGTSTTLTAVNLWNDIANTATNIPAGKYLVTIEGNVVNSSAAGGTMMLMLADNTAGTGGSPSYGSTYQVLCPINIGGAGALLVGTFVVTFSVAVTVKLMAFMGFTSGTATARATLTRIG